MSNGDDDLFEEGIQQRDRSQFELQAEYLPVKETARNEYTTEFYFFIPTTLQISKDTYTKDQFYRDLTSLIRFKTPVLSLHELIEHSVLSPLSRIAAIQEFSDPESQKRIKFELKLFGNIVRSQIRDHVKEFFYCLNDKKNLDIPRVSDKIIHFCHQIEDVLEQYKNFQRDFVARSSNRLLNKFSNYVDEYINLTAQNFLLRLLQKIRERKNPAFVHADNAICDQVIKIGDYREKMEYYPSVPEDSEERRKEQMGYRQSILNKFILESLLLSTIRQAPIQRYNHFIATVAAGLAMFLYIFLLAWYGRVFLVDATALLVMTVVLYILKDRLKDALKSVFYKLAFWWFPDYKTKIQTPDTKKTIGIEKESFTFLDKDQIPKHIKTLRSGVLHSELQDAQRMENVALYKKDVSLSIDPSSEVYGLHALHDIFRFNIGQFVRKAGDVFEYNLQLDKKSRELKKSKFPKVYHINIIVHRAYKTKEGEKRDEYEKVRLVINKDGICRVERAV